MTYVPDLGDGHGPDGTARPSPSDRANWPRLWVLFDPETARLLTELSERNHRPPRLEATRLLQEAVHREMEEASGKTK